MEWQLLTCLPLRATLILKPFGASSLAFTTLLHYGHHEYKAKSMQLTAFTG